MRSIPRSFWHEFRGAFARLPVWLPGTQIRLGDVGLLTKDGWTQVSTLDEMGIGYQTGPLGTPVEYSYHSVGAVDASTGVGAAQTAAAPVIDASATVRYRFQREGAFVLKATAVRAQQITGIPALGDAVLAAYVAGTWERTWTVVTEICRSSTTMILVAGRAGAEAAVAGSVSGAVAPVDVNATVRLATENGLAASFVSHRPATVMWAGRGVRDPLFAKARFNVRGPEDESGSGPAIFDDVTSPVWV